MGVISTQFVSPQGEKNLVAYKYSGSDKSFCYQYFFSPVAQLVVDKIIPSWLAPNVITLLGFCCTLIPHFLILSYVGLSVEGNVPRWLCWLAAIGQLVYMILDNADGKQARKTGSSSPLGLLFDHGCDAMNIFISGLSLFTIIQLGNGENTVFAYIIGSTTFFMATWEEYYVDALNLPAINGANEGVVLAIIMYVIAGIFGVDVWNTQVGPLKANEIVLLSFAFMSFVTITGNIINVYKHDKSKVLNGLYNTLTIVYMGAILLFVTFYSASNIVYQTGMARVLVYFAGFSFAKLVGHLQVSHVSHEEFQQFRRSIIFSFTVLLINTFMSRHIENSLFREDQVLIGCAIFAFLAYAHFVINIISQFSRVLKIYVFKIGRRDVEEQLIQT